MVYFRLKEVSGHEYVYLVRGYQDYRRKVRQEVLKYLGPAREGFEEEGECSVCGSSAKTWRGMCSDCFLEENLSEWKRARTGTCDECGAALGGGEGEGGYTREWVEDRVITEDSPLKGEEIPHTIYKEILCSDCYGEKVN